MTRLLTLALLPLVAAVDGGAMPPPPSVALRVAVADAVAVGKVTGIADKMEKAELYKGDNRDLKIATIKVESAVLGKLGTTLKVGFVHFPTGRHFPVVGLTKDQEAMLVLVKHPTKKDVYVLSNYYDVVPKKGNTNFKKDVEEAKRVVKALSAPLTSLKSKAAADRLFAASVLLARYRIGDVRTSKTEAVPAEESKLILTTLAEADWGAATPGDWQMRPQGLFSRLALTAKDGWEQPRDFQQIAPAAKKWCKDNAAKFKMTRFVRDKATTEPSEEP